MAVKNQSNKLLILAVIICCGIAWSRCSDSFGSMMSSAESKDFESTYVARNVSSSTYSSYAPFGKRTPDGGFSLWPKTYNRDRQRFKNAFIECVEKGYIDGVPKAGVGVEVDTIIYSSDRLKSIALISIGRNKQKTTYTLVGVRDKKRADFRLYPLRLNADENICNYNNYKFFDNKCIFGKNEFDYYNCEYYTAESEGIKYDYPYILLINN